MKRCGYKESMRVFCTTIFIAGVLLWFAPRRALAESSDADRVREAFIPVGSGVMRVLTAGDPSAPPVLLLHGATFRAELWVETGTMRRLAKRGYYVVAADLPGHGKYVNTGLPRDEIMWRLIEKMGLKRPIVIGHSMGGAYAMSLIAAHSDALLGAVLVAPAQIERYLAKLKHRTLPVLVLWGTQDTMVPLRRSKSLLSALPHSRLVLLEGASHECYLQQNEAFHAAIEVFLDQLTGGSRQTPSILRRE